MLDSDTIVKLLANVPFAILVAAYVLLRIEPVLKHLVEVEIAETEILRIILYHLPLPFSEREDLMRKLDKGKQP